MSGQSNRRQEVILSGFKPSLLELLRSHDFAEDTASELWDFAVPIRKLLGLGLGANDLRWMVRKGFVEHAKETTSLGENGRHFRATGDLTFCRRTNVVLTANGAEQARRFLQLHKESNNGAHPSHDGNEFMADHWNSCFPHWDGQTRELRYKGELVKRFRWLATNQEAILNAFEEEGWPPRILDPLPPLPKLHPKRRLIDTIKCLNRKQVTKIMRFQGDGTGEGILWEEVEAGNGSRC